MRFLILAALLTASPVAASTLQEQYSAAQAAFDKGDMAAARAGFAAVLPRLDASSRNRAQAAIVRARMGAAANALAEPEAAVALIAAALPAIARDSPEWSVAMLDLGLARELTIDYAAAAAAYRNVLAVAATDSGAHLSASIGLARTLMFDDAAVARSFADAALKAGGAAFSAKSQRDSYAQLLALRGRIALNDGQPREAREWLDKALASAGGISTKVSVADLRVRGDLALAAYQVGRMEEARKFFAYTGAGQLPSEGFAFGADMPLPPCAPVGEVARDDMAIIEFAILADGRVTGVTPIYATRRGGVALAFARAVRGWSWRPDAAAKLPAFWRQSVRLELRCANQGPAVAELGHFDRSDAELAGLDPLPPLPPVAAAALPVLNAELARRTTLHGASSPQLLPVLLALDANKAGNLAEASRNITAAMQIAGRAPVPADLKTVIRLRDAEIAAAVAAGNRASERPTMARLDALLAQLDKEGLGATRGAAQVANRLAIWSTYARNNAKATAAWRRVLAMPLGAVPDGDVLRQTARLQLASAEAAASRLDTARGLLAETGLTAEQCSAFPVTPIRTKDGRTGNDFPEAAQKWGFNGIVRVAYDIDTDGKPVDVRTVVASPPFVFSNATEALYRRVRFQPIFRDGTAVACSDRQSSQAYRIVYR